MNCMNCGKEVVGRQGKETCNSACRRALSRQHTKTLSVTSDAVSVTESGAKCDKAGLSVTSDDLAIVDGEHSSTIKDGNKKVAERDKKGNIIQGSLVSAMNADQVAAELASQKVANYPPPKGFDVSLEVW